MARDHSNAHGRAVRLTLTAVLAALPIGCGGGLWDEVTSRNFKVKSLFTPAPDPLVVLKESHNGNERAKALRKLKEPKKHGGSDADQDATLALLATAARSEPHPLCRLAAMQTLAQFEDPRAAHALIQAYYALTPEKAPKEVADELVSAGGSIREMRPDRLTFPPETVAVIQARALEALGRTKQPVAVATLVQIARQKAKPDASEGERQQLYDQRIAAVRALSRFRDPKAAEALATLLTEERDVALRDRTAETLALMTGRSMGPDGELWLEYLKNHPVESGPPVEPNVIQRVGGWFKP